MCEAESAKRRNANTKGKGDPGRPIRFLEISPNRDAVCDAAVRRDIRRANDGDASLSAAVPNPSVVAAVAPNPNPEEVVVVPIPNRVAGAGGDNRERIHRHIT